MLSIYQSIIVGLVQGITEFLPISSTAHLVLIPKFFGWQELGLKLDTALHFGTALAIIIFFWSDWIAIIKSVFKTKTDNKEKYPKNLLWQILVGSIPALIAGFLIKDIVEKTLYSPSIIAFSLVFFGIMLWLVDRFVKSKQSIGKLTYGQSLAVGVAQVFALVPGVSRSGITMIASRCIGLDRENAARFSFLLSTPVVVGAFFLEATKLNLSDITLPFVVAVLTATISGLWVIQFLLDYLKKGSFALFAIYRILLALAVIIFLIK